MTRNTGKKGNIMNNNELTENGIEAANRYLELRGYEIIESNFECRFGSIDIIARDADTWCFI